jgi:hypothetical protein
MVSKTRKNRTTLPKKAATMSELEGWRKHVFTHLGWMVLAKAKGMDTKVKAYKMSVNNLCESIKHVMGEYENHDRKHDLKVLLMEVEVLRGQMNKLL